MNCFPYVLMEIMATPELFQIMSLYNALRCCFSSKEQYRYKKNLIKL